MMEIQTMPVESQANPLNSAVNTVTASQQKQTNPKQKSFKSTLDKVCNENQELDNGRETTRDVKAEDQQPDLTNETNLSPVLVPMAMAISLAEQTMPELIDTVGNNDAELSASGVAPGTPNAVDLTKVLTVATKNQALGTAPVNTDSQVLGTVALNDTASQVFGTVSTNPDDQVLETMMLTDTVAGQGDETPKIGQIKLPMAAIPGLSSQLAQEIARKTVELNSNIEVLTSTPDQSVQNAGAIKMAANGKSAQDPIEAEPEVSLQSTQTIKTAIATADTALAAKDTFVIAPETSTAQDQGFEADLAQSTLSVPIPTQGKTDLSVAAFPDIETPPPIKDQVLQQIVQKASILTNGGQQEIHIQLKPEHLGPLNVLIVVENGAVTAKFHTDSQQVKQLLEASLPQLKQELQAQGLKVQQVDVSVGQQPMSFSNFSRQTSPHNLSKTKRVSKMGADELEQQFSNTAATVSKYAGVQSGGVDYRV